jgi:hypothetical protein
MQVFFVLTALAVLCVCSAKYTSISKGDETKILKVIFKLLHVDANPEQCVTDATGATQHFRDFAEDWKTKSYEQGLSALSSGFAALSSSMSECGLNQVQHLFDAMALATKFAKISKTTESVDKVVVGATDLVHDIEKIATAAEDGDSDAIGSAIGSFLNDWSQIVGGCGDHKGCQLVGGILRIIQEVATDIKPCEDSLLPAIVKLESAKESFNSKDYKSAVKDFASALDILSEGLKNESCGVPRIASLIGKLSPKLAKAVVKVEDGKAVKILVESADIYDDLYKLVGAIETKDYDTVGTELSNLLRVLRASGCETKACIVLEGLMASIQEELSDFDSCMKDADLSWSAMHYASEDFKGGHLKDGAIQLGHAVVGLARAVGDCHIPGIAETAEEMFDKLNDKSVANDIGAAVQLLVDGADVTLDLNSAILDFNGANWSGFGNDLGKLAQFIASTNCNSISCKIVEGLLNAAGVAFKDLKQCKADLTKAVDGFTSGAKQFEAHGYSAALKTWGSALNSVAKSVSDCGLGKELGYIEQEANVMGFANITDSHIANDIRILIHGADFYKELYASLHDMKHHDYHAVGNDLHDVMSSLNSWTTKFSCHSDFCYIVVGAVEFLTDMQGSVKECENDFKIAYDDFKDGWESFHDSHKNIIFHWKHDKAAIKRGLVEMGAGMKKVAAGVNDCHLQAIADILERLALKLGIAPEISFLEELLHILIEGVHIEKEIGDALSDFGNSNWPGFGYNMARLTKTLL